MCNVLALSVNLKSWLNSFKGKVWPQNEGTGAVQETSGSVELFYCPLLYK